MEPRVVRDSLLPEHGTARGVCWSEVIFSRRQLGAKDRAGSRWVYRSLNLHLPFHCPSSAKLRCHVRMLGHEWRNHEHKVLPLPPSVDGLGRLSGSEMPRRAARWGQMPQNGTGHRIHGSGQGAACLALAGHPASKRRDCGAGGCTRRHTDGRTDWGRTSRTWWVAAHTHSKRTLWGTTWGI